MTENEIFSPKIKKIENEIIQFLSESPLFFTKDPFINQIRSYFITRKSLTQKEIRTLTKLSTGKISQVLKKLIHWKIIEKTEVSSSGEYTYSMESIEKSFINYFNILIDQIIQWVKPLQEIEEILIKREDELKNQKGYDKFSYLVPLFLKAIKLNIDVMEDFKDALII